MKNAINYYYSLYPDDIYQTEKGYYFILNQTRYFFTKYLGDTKEIQKIYDMPHAPFKSKFLCSSNNIK